MRRLAWASLFVIAGGAAGGCASLHGDGYYACSRSGQCPTSAPVCGGDGRCHVLGVDASTSDAGTPAIDANVPPLAYEACNGGTSGTCSGSCYFDDVLDTTLDGYCTRTCTTVAECPAYLGATSACLNGRCARGCHTQSDCGDVLACSGGRWVDGASLRLCVTLPDAESFWYTTCATDTECARPLSCVNGACLRPCTTMADCVLGLEICATSSTGARGCVYNCTGNADCNGIGDFCSHGGCNPATSW